MPVNQSLDNALFRISSFWVKKSRCQLTWLLLVFLSLVLVSNHLLAAKPEIELPAYGINNQNIAIIVKRGDELSVKTAEYYQQKRDIPVEHIFTVDLPNTESMGAVAFNGMYEKLKAQLPADFYSRFLCSYF